MAAITELSILVLALFYTLLNIVGQEKLMDMSNQLTTTRDFVVSRGFLAKDHYITTKEGYILNIVQCNNPLINGGKPGGSPDKDAILFLHGITPNANVFLVNSLNAHPKDYSNYNASDMTREQLDQLLIGDPNSNTIVFTALNFGHEVWLLNRRGTKQSRGHIDPTKQAKNPNDPLHEVKTFSETFMGTFSLNKIFPSPLEVFEKKEKSVEKDNMIENIIKKVGEPVVSASLDPLREMFKPMLKMSAETFNPRYWNFSMDEQITYDMTQTIDYILEQTKREKISLVANSAGGGMVLMLYAKYPEYGDKISKSVLWAPSFYPSLPKDAADKKDLISWILMTYIGPWPFSFLSPIIRLYGSTVCNWQSKELCSDTLEAIFGLMGGQQSLEVDNWSGFWDTYSSHEYLQLIQIARTGKVLHFDWNDPIRNLIAYNSTVPPAYDLSRVTAKQISLWSGNVDILVPKANIKRTANELSVPVKEYHIQGEGLYFNHLSFYIHHNVSTLVTIPTLIELHSYE